MKNRKTKEGCSSIILVLTVIVALAFTGIWVASSHGAADSKMNKLHRWMSTLPGDGFRTVTQTLDQETSVGIYQIMFTEKIGGQNFDIRWRHYYIGIWYVESGDKMIFLPEIYIGLKEYVDLLSPKSRQYTYHHFIDRDLDGRPDSFTRQFSIIASQDDENFYLLFPEYPDGLINRDWYNPTQKEVQPLFNELVDLWLKRIP